MLADMPVNADAVTCEVRPYKESLFVDAQKDKSVGLPKGAISRKCSSAREGWWVMTTPDSGGTEACVLYVFGVDPKTGLYNRQKLTGVAKSLKGGACPPVDQSAQGFPGKDWFFLSDNVPLENAHRVKQRVESGGLAFLIEEKRQRKDGKPGLDFGNSPLGVYSISAAPPLACRTKDSFFQERFAACYKAVIYNKTVRGDWAVHIGLRKNGEYKFIESSKGVK